MIFYRGIVGVGSFGVIDIIQLYIYTVIIIADKIDPIKKGNDDYKKIKIKISVDMKDLKHSLVDVVPIGGQIVMVLRERERVY